MTWPSACVISTSIMCGTFFLYVLILARKRSENARLKELLEDIRAGKSFIYIGDKIKGWVG